MFGETVIVREFGGKPVVCRVWEVTAQKVYICTEESFKKLEEFMGKPFPSNYFPIGFPKEDVFRYNPKLKANLNNWYNDPKIWEKMVRYV